MRAGIGLVLALLSSPGGACASGGSTLERSAAAVPTAAPCVSTPEEQGMDSSVLQRAFRDIQREGKALHSLVVVRNGCLVVEAYWPPYHREQKHYLNSATKAFLSALVGIAVHDEKLREDDVAWDSDPQGRSIGSAALQMRPVDMAKLGSLYLGYGESGTNRILDREWVERALTAHVKMPARGGAAGYGYYWWLYPERKLFEAWGGAGQRIGVFRDLGLVVVMTADIPDDIPRSPFAARLYDAVRESVKVVSARPRSRRASPGTPRNPRGNPPAGRG